MGMGVNTMSSFLNRLQPTSWATAGGGANTLQIFIIIGGYGEPAMRAGANTNPVTSLPIIDIMLALAVGLPWLEIS